MVAACAPLSARSLLLLWFCAQSLEAAKDKLNEANKTLMTALDTAYNSISKSEVLFVAVFLWYPVFLVCVLLPRFVIVFCIHS